MHKSCTHIRYLLFSILFLFTGACNTFLSPGAGESNKFITSDAAAFAKKLESLNMHNEVLIALKTASSARISKTTLQSLDNSDDIIALPADSTSAPKRTKPGFAPVDAQSRQAVRNILKNINATHIVAPNFGHVITARLPEKNLKKSIAALLASPNVDYIEANQTHPVHFGSAPALQPLFSFNPANSYHLRLHIYPIFTFRFYLY